MLRNDGLDGTQLIVSWNRYEQGLMKQYLMQCAYSNDLYCFGDQKEVTKLHQMLAKHGVLQPCNYNNTNPQWLVNDIKSAIRNNLKLKNKNGKPNLAWINDNDETQFLTSFAMAIQDTKKRQPFFPGGCKLYTNGQDNKNRHIIYFYGNSKNYITLAKVKLFSLATQLTRIGLNCQTTINWSDRMKAPANQNEINNQKNVHLIDTNNFLDFSASHSIGHHIDMNKLGIGMDGVQYYTNLYRKLFDFALQKEIQDGEKKGWWKIPEFVIPLGGAWGTKLNEYIFQALNQVLGEKWKRPSKTKGKWYAGKYKQFISVKVIDNGNWHNYAKERYPNLQHIGIVNHNDHQPLFNDPKKENYMIMAGDHFAFLGNEAMYNGVTGDTTSTFKQGRYNDSSLESANMKTNFFRFYGQGQGQQTGYNWQHPQQCGFHPNNGAWIMNPKLLNMPQHYLLHCNYQGDKFYQMSENQQIQQNYNAKNIFSGIPKMKMFTKTQQNFIS